MALACLDPAAPAAPTKDRMSRRRKSPAVWGRLSEIALAVPQVMAHRTWRMALAGPVVSTRDAREFARMSDEKKDAFAESWAAMSWAAVQTNHSFLLSLGSAMWRAPIAGAPTAHSIALQWQRAAMGVLAEGLTPVHRRAVANARRLRGTKLR